MLNSKQKIMSKCLIIIIIIIIIIIFWGRGGGGIRNRENHAKLTGKVLQHRKNPFTSLDNVSAVFWLAVVFLFYIWVVASNAFTFHYCINFRGLKFEYQTIRNENHHRGD